MRRCGVDYASRVAAACQILRAASVFGETFWLLGVALLLQTKDEGELHQQVATLVHHELLVANADSRYPKQQELRFCQSLIRDTAYSLLTEEERVFGHRLAGLFLEQQGESESAVLSWPQQVWLLKSVATKQRRSASSRSACGD